MKTVQQILRHKGSAVWSVTPDSMVYDALRLMTEKRVRHLPVLIDDQVVGVVSIGDLVKASLDEKDFMIKQLENYITGSR